MTTNALRHLADLIHALERVHGRWEVEMVPGAPVAHVASSAGKLEHLRDSGRDFMKHTPQLQTAINTALARVVYPQLAANPNAIDPLALCQVAAAAARDHIVARFERQGGDVSLRPLHKDYRRAKQQDPLRDTRIGIARGILLRDLKHRARWSVRRVG